MKNAFSRYFLIFLLLLSWGNLQAGDKLRRIYRNVVALEQKTLLVPSVLPDPFYLEKLNQKKKGGEKAAAYLRQIEEANQNLRRFLDEYFDFTEYQFLELDSANYRSTLASYDPKEYAVLQFGTSRQYGSTPPQKLGGYYTKVWGIFDTDAVTPLFLVPGRQDQFNKKEYAEMMVTRLNENLHQYREKARRKGITVKKR